MNLSAHAAYSVVKSLFAPARSTPASATPNAPLLAPDEIVRLIEHADALRNTRAHGREVFLRHPGDARSAHLGRGLDFEEVRAYQAGDDIRAMDWRTTARTGKPYLKVYREEHHPALQVVVDRGATMRFGTSRQLKAAQAARVAILAAVLESSAFACIGGAMIAESTLHLPCLSKQAGIMQLAHAASAACPPLEFDQHAERARWHAALQRLAATLVLGSRVLIVSDFRWLTETNKPLLAHLALHHDVAAVHIYDAVERELPVLGRAGFYDLTLGRMRWVDTTQRRVREVFAQHAAADQAIIEQSLRQIEVSYFPLRTDADALGIFIEGLDG